MALGNKTSQSPFQLSATLNRHQNQRVESFFGVPQLKSIKTVFFSRYGDLCPKSIPGKLFAMIWFLIGLVIFSVFMGTLTSLLTVTTVRKTIGSPQGTDVKTVTESHSLGVHMKSRTIQRKELKKLLQQSPSPPDLSKSFRLAPVKMAGKLHAFQHKFPSLIRRGK